MALTSHPRHRSVRAERPHTALTLDDDEQRPALVESPRFWCFVVRTPNSPCNLATRLGVRTINDCLTFSLVSLLSSTDSATVDVRHCSPASQVLRDCLTSRPCFILRRGACRHYGISPSPTDPRPKTRMFPGSPSFREDCFQPCAWPLTPWGRNRTRLVFRSTSLSPSP